MMDSAVLHPEDELVVVAEYGALTEAHLDRVRLEAGGIPCVVQNESQGYQMNAVVISGTAVTLHVRARDEAIARQLIYGSEVSRIQAVPECCPKCHGSSLKRLRPNFLWILVCLALQMVAPNLYKRRYRCQSCGHTWKPAESES